MQHVQERGVFAHFPDQRMLIHKLERFLFLWTFQQALDVLKTGRRFKVIECDCPLSTDSRARAALQVLLSVFPDAELSVYERGYWAIWPVPCQHPDLLDAVHDANDLLDGKPLQPSSMFVWDERRHAEPEKERTA
jgi:hypothetical protein